MYTLLACFAWIHLLGVKNVWPTGQFDTCRWPGNASRHSTIGYAIFLVCSGFCGTCMRLVKPNSISSFEIKLPMYIHVYEVECNSLLSFYLALFTGVICFCPCFPKESKRDHKISFCQSVRPELCGCCNSTTSGPIRSISSSMEMPWPVDVQRHGYWPVEHLRECLSGTQTLRML